MSRATDAALDRSEAAWNLRNDRTPPPLPSTKSPERHSGARGPNGSASLSRDHGSPEDRAGEPISSPGYRGSVDDYSGSTWDSRIPPWHGANSGRVGSNGAQVLGGGNHLLAGLEWAHDRRRGESVPAGTRLARGLRQLDSASVVLLVAIIVAVLSLTSSMITAFARSVFYDDRPAMVFHKFDVVPNEIARGNPLKFVMTYTKRAECHPPLGTSEISYRVWYYPRDGAPYYRWLSFGRPSLAPAGTNVVLTSPTIVPMVDLDPGTYGFQVRAKYTCGGASDEQEIDSPVAPFRVV